MEKEAIETDVQTVATGEEVQVVPLTEDDLEAKYKALEAENARLLEQSSTLKVGLLKERSKRGSIDSDDDEEKVRRIVQETLADSNLAQISKEKDDLLHKVFKENKELRLANLNKPSTTPVAMGSHSEGLPVRDTLVTPEQIAAFKARGWDDKKIANYKKNLQKYRSV